MPEGDTIHRTARTLRNVLVGHPVRRFEAPRLTVTGPRDGTPIDAVDAIGKHLLIRFGDGSVLHTHMRMTGSWHTYPPDVRWQRPRHQVRALIETDDAVAVCFEAPVVELLTARAAARHPALLALGPDLLADEPDIETALTRMASIPEPDTSIADVLLDQRVAAGLGNVYRSELCFLERLHPLTALADVPVATRRRLLERGASLLRFNLGTSSRTTVPGARHGTLYVYGRGGQPCRRCGEPIAVDHQGDQARVTYWCPRDQPSPDRR